MPVQATVILDSGCFLPGNEKNSFTEIGYFQSGNAAQDIRIIADGKELQSKNPMSLGDDLDLQTLTHTAVIARPEDHAVAH